MQSQGIELVILVKNRTILEYRHENQVYVEGRANSNYEIEVRNHTLNRVEAVISVDGLSILDGKEAGTHSQGYLINGYGTIRIPGWKLDLNNVAKFAFAGKQDSYASHRSGGTTLNNGVIGVMVFNEKAPIYQFHNVSWPDNYNQRYDNTSLNDQLLRDRPRGIVPDRTSWSASEASVNNMMSNSISSSSASNTMASASTTNATPQSLGTGFGATTGFVTRVVSFTRGEMLTILNLYYDSLSGLRAKGVPIERKRQTRPQPNAFPNLHGCQPPEGWQG